MNNYSYWENRKTTSEELSIIKILLNKDLISLGTILHIGTGNGEALKKLHKKSKKFIGITIAGNEFNYIKTLNYYGASGVLPKPDEYFYKENMHI